MAISLEQYRSVLAGGVNSQALSFTTTPTVGNLILVALSTYAGNIGTSAITDNQGNTYTRRSLAEPEGQDTDVAIFTAIASTSSGTFTVTANPDGTSADLTMVIMDFSGCDADPFDQQSSGTGNGTAVSTGNATPSVDGALMVAAMTHAGTDRTITEEAGWTLIYENEGGSSNMPISVVYKVQSTAAAEDADWTIGTGAVYWGAVVTSFAPAEEGGEPTAITPADVTSLSTMDAVSVTAITPFTPGDMTSLTVMDAAAVSFGGTLPTAITPQDIVSLTTVDAAIVHAITAIAPSEQISTTVMDAAIVHAVTAIVPGDQVSATVTDAVTVHAITTVTPSDQVSVTVTDAASVSYSYPTCAIIVGENISISVMDASSVTAITLLAPGDMASMTVMDDTDVFLAASGPGNRQVFKPEDRQAISAGICGIYVSERDVFYPEIPRAIEPQKEQ